MAERFQLPIPMWVAQFQLLGGSRKIVTFSVIYAGALVAGFFGFWQLTPNVPPGPYVSGALNLLAGIQILAVLLGGCNAVYRAMLRDFQTGMVESHRLTPMSNVGVVLGYIFGSTAQVAALFAITACFGAVLVVYQAFPVADWILGHVLLVTTGLMLYAGTVFLGMGPRKPLNPAPFLIVIALLSAPAAFVPAAALLFGVYAAYLCGSLLVGGATAAMPAVFVLSVINLVQAGFWIAASAAKYRRPDLPAMNAARGLILLALTLVYGVGGAIMVGLFDYRNLFPWRENPGSSGLGWTITLTASLLIAVIPVVGAGECRRLIARGTMPRSRYDRVSDWVTIGLAAILLCAVSAGLGWPLWTELVPRGISSGLAATDAMARSSQWVLVWGVTAAAFVIALVTARAVFALTARLRKSGLVIGTAVLLFMWSVPIVADAVHGELTADYGRGAPHSWLVTLCPPGLLAAIWMDLWTALWPGFAVQLALAVLLTLVATSRRSEVRPAVSVGPGDPGEPPTLPAADCIPREAEQDVRFPDDTV